MQREGDEVFVVGIGQFLFSKHDTTYEVIKKALAGFREFCFTRNPARVELTGYYCFRR